MPIGRKNKIFETTNSKIILMLLLLIMALLRLVWIQIRDYDYKSTLRASISIKSTVADMTNCEVNDREIYKPISEASPNYKHDYSSLISPGFIPIVMQACQGGLMRIGKFADWNRVFKVLAILFLVFYVRFVAGSWVLAAAIGTALLSRGTFLAKIGLVSYDVLIMALLSGWASFSAHFFKTAASFSLFGGICCLILASSLEETLIGLGLAYPFFCLAIFVVRKRVRAMLQRTNIKSVGLSERLPNLGGSNNLSKNLDDTWSKIRSYLPKQIKSIPHFDLSKTYTRGSVFTILKIPFAGWLLQQRRLEKLFFGWTVITVGLLILHIYVIHESSNILGLRSLTILDLRVIFVDYVVLWLSEQAQTIDFLFVISLIIIFSTLFLPPEPSMIAIYESNWFFIFSFTLVGLFTFFNDVLDYKSFELAGPGVEFGQSKFMDLTSMVTYWFEPVILTLGCVSLYYLLKSLYFHYR